MISGDNMGKIDKTKYTPMMRQYLEIKEDYPDTLVLYRLGDFYELFFNDALVASKELDIVLTGRDAGMKDRVPMCGVPHHAVEGYLDKLTSKGYKVAIVEQVEDPKDAKGIVRREVVRVITPGTITEGSVISEDDNNFLSTVSREKNRFIFAYSDLSTGENYITDIPLNEELLLQEILNLKTKEIVISSSFDLSVFSPLEKVTSITYSIYDEDSDVSYLKKLTLDLDKEEQKCANRLLNYILKTQKKVLIHMQEFTKYDIRGFLKIDFTSRRNLELLETIRFQNKKNTLFYTLNKTKTAMGARFLKRNIVFPLIDKAKIEARYDIIDALHKAFIKADDIRAILNDIYDLERIVGRIAYDNANPKDFLQLKQSLKDLPALQGLLKEIGILRYFPNLEKIDDFVFIFKTIDDAINEDAPYTIKEGGIFKDSYNEELDELRHLNDKSQDYLLKLEQRERKRTNIKNLKVGYNKVFGYYIEISKGNIPLVKDEFGYIRKQTLVNSERYITEELKEKEAMILRAEEKMISLEYNMFVSMRDLFKEYTYSLQALSKDIALLDMMQSLARVAKENNYVRPKFQKEGIKIITGRHPVLEQFEDNFIPNDLVMDEEKIMLITGPNMSGKSTYMRQIALIAIMAQIGSFVSAKEAVLPLFDAIYTRIGASDDIISGESTFMVEMLEVNKALQNATSNSLIILDEIGRGTATYDGMSLAQSIIEYIHNNINAYTLFSTHYHELTALDQSLMKLKNIHVSIKERLGEVIFMHKVLPGAVDKSYGINVAKLAKLPLEIILRATDLLHKYEAQAVDSEKFSLANYQAPLIYDSKTELEKNILEEIETIDLNKTSPLDALNKLSELQKKLKK